MINKIVRYKFIRQKQGVNIFHNFFEWYLTLTPITTASNAFPTFSESHLKYKYDANCDTYMLIVLDLHSETLQIPFGCRKII